MDGVALRELQHALEQGCLAEHSVAGFVIMTDHVAQHPQSVLKSVARDVWPAQHSASLLKHTVLRLEDLADLVTDCEVDHYVHGD